MMSGWCRCLPGLLLVAVAGTGIPAEDVRPRVLERRPHDPAAFTQGLLSDGGFWLESTGRYGESGLREVEKQTGRVIRELPMSGLWFGEGLALHGGKLFQLTWRSGICRVVDRKTFVVVTNHRYPGEGWGLTSDGTSLYLSDGSSRIRVLNPETFKPVRFIRVTEAGRNVAKLNELEWVDGELWANVFQTKRIVRIDPDSGKVLGGIDLSHLPVREDVWRGQDVLNGIARDPETGQIWVTGKYWKALYRIEWPVEPAEASGRQKGD